MNQETERLLAILHNGSDSAVLDNAEAIAAELRRLSHDLAAAARVTQAIESLAQTDNPFLVVGDCSLERVYGTDEWRILRHWTRDGEDFIEDLWRGPDFVSGILALARREEEG